MGLRFQFSRAVGLLVLVLAGALSAGAFDDLLQPQTKLRVTVVQWNPAKGDYQAWQAIGGEFAVSQTGTLSLPVIGQVEAAGRDATSVANEISTRLQKRMGLLEKPDTTVEILEYPPIYVVGDVTTPGEYRYRTGLTVLQALALSGGPFRQENTRSADEIRLVGELQGVRDSILRTKARIARLNAEMAGASEVVFPDLEAGDGDTELATTVQAQERIIFQTRVQERERQVKSLEELRELLEAEIKVLEQKVKAADIGIENARKELNNVSVLVEKGIAIASRRSELEQRLASYQADRLDQVTAIMRARQSITEATRNLAGVEDRHKTEVAGALQQEQAQLQRLLLNQEVSQKLLLEALASATPSTKDAEAIEFFLTRNEGGESKEIPATRSTLLMPGDVVTVRQKSSPLAAPGTSSSSRTEAGPALAAEVGQ